MKLESTKEGMWVDVNEIKSLVKNNIQDKFLPKCGRVAVAN